MKMITIEKNAPKILIICLILGIVTLSGCSTQDVGEVPEDRQQGISVLEKENESGTSIAEQIDKTIQVIGQVTEVLGNEILVQIGTMARDENIDIVGENRERPNTAEGGEQPPMGGSGERPNMAEGGERPAMGGGAERPNMPEGGAMGTEDIAQTIELSDETKTFHIPVGTPVSQFGSEMTFSQIQEEMYITIIMDESETILAVNVLG